MGNSLFVCDCCGCVDSVELAAAPIEPGKALCSACVPGSTWHGYFPKEKYDPTQDVVVNRSNEGVV